MIYYNEYLRALNDAFSVRKKQCNQRKDELERQYNDGEARIKSRFQTKMEQLRADTNKALKEIDNEISTLLNGKKSDSFEGQQRNLREIRDNLLQQYNELARLSEEKSSKRSEVRSKLFTFWWK